MGFAKIGTAQNNWIREKVFETCKSRIILTTIGLY
jgi:hypothetical protein